MKRISSLALVLFCLPSVYAAGSLVSVGGSSLRVGISPTSGLPQRIETLVGKASKQWLQGPVRLSLLSEVTKIKATSLAQVGVSNRGGQLQIQSMLVPLKVALAQNWSRSSGGLTWTFEFTGKSTRVGHEVVLEFPLLARGMKVFTPSQRGVMDVAAYPKFAQAPYGATAWTTGETQVIPLVSVFDPQSDSALTFALPASDNIPQFQVEWNGQTLRLRMGHRGIGGNLPSKMTVLVFSHRADYRDALKVYSDRFPEYFKPGLPRGQAEGTFYYHHIQDHPAFEEMKRQSVRYIWSSFWFTYLGEYLPDDTEWEPYTYARWWNLKETMSDPKIQAFIKQLKANGIGTYAYFNVTEYGGMGGKLGDTAAAAKALRERFSNALVKDEKGSDIPTWEGAMAMNPGSRYALWPFLEDQAQRHLKRLPGLEGFIVDRLDWASFTDYGHDDGLTMVGNKPAENLAQPVAEAIQRLCKLSHSAGKRVFVNQFYRIEPLRDVDGYCHESDYLPALGYLSPYRPAAAWHQQKPYTGDLLAFEAHLKQRLQWALFPQMISHEFPISQQAASPSAADMLELYAPLFDTLIGKEQVLEAHCIETPIDFDANLFRVPGGRYVVAVTSRSRFLSRGDGQTGAATIRVRVADGRKLQWAQVIRVGATPVSAQLIHRAGFVDVTWKGQGSASMVVLGRGKAPVLGKSRANTTLKTRRFPVSVSEKPVRPRPRLTDIKALRLRISGSQVGAPGMSWLTVANRKPVAFSGATVEMRMASKLPVTLPVAKVEAADDGTWFVPTSAKLIAVTKSGKSLVVAQSGSDLRLRWCVPIPQSIRYLSRDSAKRGDWKGNYGNVAAWIAGQASEAQKGYRLDTGAPYIWQAITEDARALQLKGGQRTATCWYAPTDLALTLTPPDNKPYRATLYIVDFDRNGRSFDVLVDGKQAVPISKQETGNGIYLTWVVQGRFEARIHKREGFNAVLSGVFIDPE